MNHVHPPRRVLAPTKNLKLLTQLTATSRVWVGNNGFKKKKKAKCCCTFARNAPARVMLAPTIWAFCHLPCPKSSRLGQIKLVKPRQMPVLAVVCFCPPSLLYSTPHKMPSKICGFLSSTPRAGGGWGGEIGQDYRRVYKSSHHFSLLVS